MDQYIGKMLDNRYEILERIGTGGMAIVYKAKCHRLNRLVAIKILKSDLAQNEEFRRRFNAESQAVAQLSHPNIVSVYDVSRGGDMEYIVMELIDGITLKQYMEKRGQLNWRESLHFITQIMRGLSHAHSRGIIHRDIKPQNIMVLRDGSVKVADFGIACLADSAQTLTQEALGSVHYISPEQARGDRPDARSDIYSSGVVLYEMLTGRLPFEGESAVSVAIQHLSSIPLAPREINPDIPEQLELICMKAMAPDLEHRYQSADAMIADLEAFRKNPEVRLSRKGMRLHRSVMKSILAVGVPSIIMVAIGSVMNFTMNQILIGFTSTAVAVFGAYFKLQSFIFMPIFGLNNAMVSIVAYNYGARKPDRIRKAVLFSCLAAFLFMLCGFAVFQLMPEVLLSMFDPTAEFLAIGCKALQTISWAFPIAGFCVVLSSVFQALGTGLYATIVSLARQLLVLLPVAYLLSLSGRLELVWWSFPIAEMASITVTALLLLRIYRQKLRPILEEQRA